MKRNNFRILWYIIAVALFLVAIAGLNLKLQGDHAKENKTTQSATNTKLNIALVNEDQNVSNGKESSQSLQCRDSKTLPSGIWGNHASNPDCYRQL